MSNAPSTSSPDALAQSILRRIAPELLEARAEELVSFGAFCAGELEDQAAYSDRIHPPVWRNVPVDPAHPGERRGAIFLNPRYEACHQEVYARGFIADLFAEADPAPQLWPLIGQYLVSQSDISIGCPFAMTHPVALIVAAYAPDAVREKYLPELTRTDGETKSGGTWATEKHSGSDVAQTQTKAEPQSDGTVRLTGQKWFTSNAGSGLALATARAEGAPDGAKGLGLYLVPSHIDDDWQTPNDYEITHLKEKIGTRALATGEVRLDGALAYEVAAPPDGLRVMMAALGCSRAHNAMAAAGMMRRALMEAHAWVQTRETFGKRLIDHALVRKRLLEIATQWIAGTLLAFEEAKSFDEAWGADDDAARLWSRIVTALAKYKTAEQAVWCMQKALGLIGGNGYTEDYPIARLYRDVMVLPVWEGPEQIQALELLRLIAGKAPGGAVFIQRLGEIQSDLPDDQMAREKERLGDLRAGLRRALTDLQAADDAAKEATADSFLHKMSDALCYALLCEHVAWEISDTGSKSALLPVCDAYYRTTFAPDPTPSTEPDPLLQSFDAVMSVVGAG
ncbi:putative acyl-CoA dehydrogenase AidB [Methyloligella halotolerans]|uniref:Putative acyl-CoA dehydrogenase AidB n=1 Tax=Methyloligella halotolerans TaxID=1177755 RepID=A0A1E2S1A3_9HYPH|nr:acyl-CoA dehydrogenase family protein [Methyloligella halotolerans]ODA68109.1 putative acyl-CoA dehydrogenase AidB [Methyloligella halotolerans]